MNIPNTSWKFFILSSSQLIRHFILSLRATKLIAKKGEIRGALNLFAFHSVILLHVHLEQTVEHRRIRPILKPKWVIKKIKMGNLKRHVCKPIEI